MLKTLLKAGMAQIMTGEKQGLLRTDTVLWLRTGTYFVKYVTL